MPFSDVPITNEFCPDIEWAVSENISRGYADGTFRPTAGITRQAMASYLIRTAALLPHSGDRVTAAPCTSRPFPDVLTSNPFCIAIGWGAANHIFTGYADHKFHPRALITRQAAAAFISRLGEYPYAVPRPSCTSPPFPDVPTSNPFCAYVADLAADNVISGYSDGNFHPTSVVTREATTAFLYRLIAYKNP
jgi:hypothetical protein